MVPNLVSNLACYMKYTYRFFFPHKIYSNLLFYVNNYSIMLVVITESCIKIFNKGIYTAICVLS